MLETGCLVGSGEDELNILMFGGSCLWAGWTFCLAVKACSLQSTLPSKVRFKRKGSAKFFLT